jgi:membrane-associated phospholipid phosphatase
MERQNSSVTSPDEHAIAARPADAVQRAGTAIPAKTPRLSMRALKRLLLALAVAGLVLSAIWAGLGFLITGPLADSWVVALDRDVATWLVEHRTAPLNFWTNVGSLLAQTFVKVAVTVVVAIAMLLAWRSWREPLLICATQVLEGLVFVTVTWLVARPRPEVDALDEVTVASSFPSGHTGAAAAYCAITIVIFERTRNIWIRTVAVILAVAVPLSVGLSRMYRGVHYLTDVVAGLALGAACVYLAFAIVQRIFGPAGVDPSGQPTDRSRQ